MCWPNITAVMHWCFDCTKNAIRIILYIYLSIYLKSQDYGDVGAEAQQGRLTM